MDANGVFTMLNPGKGTWQVWKQGAELASASRGSRIRDVIAGRGDTLWLAYEDGLYRFTRSDGQFQHYHTGNGLKGGNLVYALQMDAAGNIWFNTFNQIIRLHPATETFTYFSEIHGVYTTFNRLCAITFSDGTMGFGGANGLIRFDPREIRPARRFPPVVLRSVRVGNRSLAMEENVEFLKDLQVDYQDNGFTFEVVALEFTGEHYQSFAWKLEGFDGDWIEAGPVGRITYTNLPPGNYTLHSYATLGSDGQPGATLSTPFIVQATLLQTRWFQVLLGLGTLGVVFLAYRSRLSALRRNERRLEAMVDTRTAELQDRAIALAEADREKNQLMERLRHQARHDSLTGLPNRSRADHYLEECLEEATKGGRPLFVALLDVDHFKRINDQHSHQAGDRVLVWLADQMRRFEQLWCARIGGEEFLVLCRPDATMNAPQLFDRLRASVEASPAPLSDGASIPVTVSIGWTNARDHATSAKALAEADRCLYRAKRDGRNRVVPSADLS